MEIEELYMELWQVSNYLQETDYVAEKLAEVTAEWAETGDNTKVIEMRKYYADVLKERQIKRQRKKELENLLKVE